MKTLNTANMMLCALFAALSAILSQISVPIGPVPINLTHISVFLAAGLLGARYGVVSQAVFVFLGAVGVPVFSKFSGGIGTILGPTGGFIAGYIACVFLTGLIIDRYGKSVRVLSAAMICGLLATYLPGILWFMHVAGTGAAEALFICVIPFLPGDALKIVLSVILVKRLSPLLRQQA
ncbi:MAG: biotin transporter BioY [Clostridiales Family XIII bacterium]|jgi:biotin transport system substrate-specific component|nr:biotin transporter BioY [Clostridiales Family XIII bacterium]